MDSQEFEVAKELSYSLSEEDCSLHGEKFELFCLVDKQPVCSVCRDQMEHAGHQFTPISEVAQSCKDRLEAEVYYVTMFHEENEHYKEQFERTVEQIESQAEHTERQIKQQFEKLHQFLRDEEEATITALREEEEQKKMMMKEKLEEMDRHISVLSNIINDSEEKMKDDDFCFLKEFPVLMERVQISSQPDTQTPSGALIDVPRYLGNLSFRVWKKMQDIIQNTPVILDPNTAHPYLVLSDDLTSVRNAKMLHHLPNNPERFDCFYCVLGSEGFNSGTHSWDVEVKKSPSWSLGVTTASNQRSGFFFNSNVWSVCYSLNVESLLERLFCRGYSVDENPDRVRVYLDYDGGTVSFSDPVTNTHLHTFTTTFTDTVFLFFCCNFDSSLRILPFSSQ